MLFLKLLFVNVAQEENWDLVQVSNTIGVTIEALHKLLLVSQKHSVIIQLLFTVGNRAIQSHSDQSLHQ